MSFQTGSLITYEARDGVCWLTMDRPEARNALSSALKTDMAAALAEFEATDDLRVLILTGSDCGTFSSGGDLKAVAAGMADKPGSRAETALGGPDIFKVLSECRKPLIAAIDGYALAGGFELALCCDIRVATTRSSFGLPEPRNGHLAGFGLDNLSRMIPLGEAMRIQLTGGRISATRAYQIGLIQEVADTREEMFQQATSLAAEILLCSPTAVQTIKHVVKVGRNLPLLAASHFSEPYKDAVHRSAEGVEGPLAFAEKRPPSWTTR